jgi:hypothetical protein
MNELNSWTEVNWYAVGSLLVQFGFLAAAFWFARNFLRTIRVFQEQVGALLKLSITGTPVERQSESVAPRRLFADGSPYWLPHTEPHGQTAPMPADRGSEQHLGALHALVLWLQAPMHSAQVSAWRRLLHWLQAPAGS